MSRWLRGLALVALVGSTALVSLASDDPNTARGFSADNLYHFGEIDTVDLFNGNLALVLPIGGEYPVNAGFSYRLQLTYNSNVWDFRVEEQAEVTGEGAPITVAQPGTQFNEITINFSQAKSIDHGKVSPATFNLGSTFIHEAFHASTGQEDKINGVIRLVPDWTGPVVDFVNKVRAERGLPLRAAYISTPALKRGRSQIHFKGVKKKNPEKIYYVTRDKANGR